MMNRSIFGWSLPPGCSMNDIERAFGGGETLDDAFESQGNLTKEELGAWDNEDPAVMSLVTKALEWAYKAGCDACQADEEENKFYEQMAKEYEENKDNV